MSLNYRVRWLLLLLLLAPGLAMAAGLKEWLSATPGGTLRGLDAVEQGRLQTLFSALFADCQLVPLELTGQPLAEAAAPCDLATEKVRLVEEAAALGLSLDWSEFGGQGIALLSEQPDRREGRGAFAFRLTAAASESGPSGNTGFHGSEDAEPIVLQAPHRFTDLKTGAITRLLFAEHPFLAAAWSTVRRDQIASDGGGTDLSRRDDTALIALTRAFSANHPAGLVVQIHGFGQSDKRAAGVDLILSNGTHAPDAGLQRLFACLNKRLEARVLLYPWDVSILGATRNPVGAALRSEGHLGFRHVELSASLRERLLNDAGEREILADCLLDR